MKLWGDPQFREVFPLIRTLVDRSAAFLSGHKLRHFRSSRTSSASTSVRVSMCVSETAPTHSKRWFQQECLTAKIKKTGRIRIFMQWRTPHVNVSCLVSCIEGEVPFGATNLASLWVYELTSLLPQLQDFSVRPLWTTTCDTGHPDKPLIARVKVNPSFKVYI